MIVTKLSNMGYGMWIRETEKTCPGSSARIYRPSFGENKPKTLVFYD